MVALFSVGTVFSQSLYKPVESVVIQEYFDSLYKFDPRLISGDYYQPRFSIPDGHPFFIDEEWKTGSVMLDGTLYDDLLLKYDIISNELVLNTKNMSSFSLQLVLKKKHIAYFNMGDHFFRPFPGSFQSDSLYFCEVLVQGDTELLLLKSKTLSVVSDGLTVYRYLLNQAEYLHRNGVLYRYWGRPTLYKLFPEIKADIRRYLKEKRLKYKRLKLEDSINIVNHCNLLLGEK